MVRCAEKHLGPFEYEQAMLVHDMPKVCRAAHGVVLGKCARVYAGIFGILLALRRMDLEERSPAKGSFEPSQSHQTSMACGM